MAKKIVKKTKSASAKKTARPKATAVKSKPAAAKPVKKKVVKGFGANDLKYFKGIITEKRKEILEELVVDDATACFDLQHEAGNTMKCVGVE